MNKQFTPRGDENELALAVIKQAVEDLKRCAELDEYYYINPPKRTWNLYNNTYTDNALWFEHSTERLVLELIDSNVIELSYYSLENGYNFWLECINRIKDNNKHWAKKYNNVIQFFLKELERIKI